MISEETMTLMTGIKKKTPTPSNFPYSLTSAAYCPYLTVCFPPALLQTDGH